MKKIFISFVAALCATVGFAQNYDLNGDGSVNSSDVVALYNYIASGGSSGGGNNNYDPIPFFSQTFTVKGVSFNMIAVEGGTFTMGATPEQQDPYFDEEPTHQVTLSSYYIGETEVTQALWTAVTGNSVEDQRDKANKDWSLSGVGYDYPMYYVSWEDCQDFITKLNDLTGKKFRLPTEAEWEYAARGGNKSKGYQYSGSNNLDNVAWHNDNSGSKTHIVKTKQPNELGIYDMSGNVWEWCQDWYSSTYYSVSDTNNPQGPSTGSGRVFRGGSWNYYARGCRSAYRSNGALDGLDTNLGLRLVLSE